MHALQFDTAALPVMSEKVPAGQFVQVLGLDDPIAVEYVPTPQGRQSPSAALPDVSENVPAGHRIHSSSTAFPVVSAYVPDGQSVHESGEVDPVAIEYVPAGHSLQVVAARASEKVPAWQSRQVDSELCAELVDILPAGQPVHAPEPSPPLKVPATQGVHAPPSGPVYPRLHVQPDDDDAPGRENEYKGQTLQSDSFVLPQSLENVPAGQRRHSAEPTMSLNVPARHARHVVVEKAEALSTKERLQPMLLPLLLPLQPMIPSLLVELEHEGPALEYPASAALVYPALH